MEKRGVLIKYNEDAPREIDGRFNFGRFIVEYISIRYKMYKKILLILLAAALAIAGVWYVYTQYFRGSQEEQNMVIGGDKDESGCLVGAGYSWCESKKKCLRAWEEPCEEVVNESSF